MSDKPKNFYKFVIGKCPPISKKELAEMNEFCASIGRPTIAIVGKAIKIIPAEKPK